VALYLYAPSARLHGVPLPQYFFDRPGPSRISCRSFGVSKTRHWPCSRRLQRAERVSRCRLLPACMFKGRTFWKTSGSNENNRLAQCYTERPAAFIHGPLNNLNKKLRQWFHFLTIKMYFLWTNARIAAGRSWMRGSFIRSYKANFRYKSYHTLHSN